MVDGTANPIGGVAAIAAGDEYSLALKGDGTVWAWGRNYHGQLGNGTHTDSSTPVQVSGSLGNVIAISTIEGHTLALKRDGTVAAWGENAYGSLGNGTNVDSSTPVAVSSLSGIIAVAAGAGHSLALKGDGTMWAWGSDHDGQLGDDPPDSVPPPLPICCGVATTRHSTTPVRVSTLSGVTAIAAGGQFSLALNGDGWVWAWGSNASGQLGNGTNVHDIAWPVKSLMHPA